MTGSYYVVQMFRCVLFRLRCHMMPTVGIWSWFKRSCADKLEPTQSMRAHENKIVWA